MKPIRSEAFTLVELLTVIAIIAVLASLVFTASQSVSKNRDQTAALSNMRQVGIGFMLYAGEHDYELPGRTQGQADRWPKLLSEYLKDTRVFAAPGDPQNWLARNVDPLSNSQNNTSYIMNGYNDAGTMDDPNISIRVNRFPATSTIILLGTPNAGSRHFYMDFLEGKNGNHVDILNLTAYGDGSDYVFADGSARFIRKADYDDTLWLVDKSFPIPPRS